MNDSIYYISFGKIVKSQSWIEYIARQKKKREKYDHYMALNRSSN